MVVALKQKYIGADDVLSSNISRYHCLNRSNCRAVDDLFGINILQKVRIFYQNCQITLAAAGEGVASWFRWELRLMSPATGDVLP
ncbi:MAG: hypothetical protein GC191_00970 [Azospirillum sp.]|nr:hypothetical protein [Azospirillum sp.]